MRKIRAAWTDLWPKVSAALQATFSESLDGIAIGEAFSSKGCKLVLEVFNPDEFFKDNWSLQVIWIQDGVRRNVLVSFADEDFAGGQLMEEVDVEES